MEVLSSSWLRPRTTCASTMPPLLDVAVTTLLGQRLHARMRPDETLGDVRAWLARRLGVPPAEQVLVACGKQPDAASPLGALSPGGAARLHLVRRPTDRAIVVSARLSGQGRAGTVRVGGLRHCCSVAEARAATRAALQAGGAAPPPSFGLLLRGRLLDEEIGLLACEYGLDDGCTLLVVPSRGERSAAGGSFSAQVKILGVPSLRVQAARGCCVRELKEAVGAAAMARWGAENSALRRRCQCLDFAQAELHFAPDPDDECCLRLGEGEAVRETRRGVFFVLPALHTLDAGALRLLAPASGQLGEERSEEEARAALLACARAELQRQRASEAAHPDCRLVNGRRQRSIKRSRDRDLRRPTIRQHQLRRRAVVVSP